MASEYGILEGDRQVHDVLDLYGTARDAVTVRPSGRLNLYGVVNGPLHVMPGGVAMIYGTANSVTNDGGKVEIYGIVRSISGAGETFIDPKAIVMGP